MQSEKNPRRISPARALSKQPGCYFLQQPMLQHCLPLQQVSFVGGVVAVAVQINAARLRIKRRYFIISPVLIFRINPAA